MEGLYGAVTEEIGRYTGLSPAAFFTIAGMMVVVYRIVTGMFVGPEDYNKPPVAATIDTVDSDSKSNFVNKYFNSAGAARGSSVQMGDMTEEQLREYDGSDPNKPLLMAIRAQIYDVSSSRNFYGPGGPYAMFAGREASRALALLSFKPQDINGNLEGLGPDELGILQDWEDKFIEKYDKVGQLVAEQTTTNADEKTEVAADDAQPQAVGSSIDMNSTLSRRRRRKITNQAWIDHTNTLNETYSGLKKLVRTLILSACNCVNSANGSYGFSVRALAFRTDFTASSNDFS